MSFTVIGIGEVLWDLLPDGPQLGGAPVNFVLHTQALGAHAPVITRVGCDRLGRGVLERFRKMNVIESTVQVDDDLPTGTATVSLSAQGIPQFVIQENVAWDRIRVTALALETVGRANAVCFGTLAQRHPASRKAIQQLVAAASAGALRVLDINLRHPFYDRDVIESSLRLANLLKLNDDELGILTEMYSLGGDVRQRVVGLAETFELKGVVLTSGARGSLVYRDGCWSEQPARAVQVVDTVGAGDAFTAALTMGWLSRKDLGECHFIAAEVAGYVCSQPGATPSLQGGFKDVFV